MKEQTIATAAANIVDVIKEQSKQKQSTTEVQLIKNLYKGLKSYYDYASNLEDAIFECGDDIEERVFDKMPSQEEDHFNHKDCRFLLAEIEAYLDLVYLNPTHKVHAV